LNVNGYYKSLQDLADNMISEGFLKKENKDMMMFSDNIEEILERFENYHPSHADKWIDERIL